MAKSKVFTRDPKLQERVLKLVMDAKKPLGISDVVTLAALITEKEQPEVRQATIDLLDSGSLTYDDEFSLRVPGTS